MIQSLHAITEHRETMMSSYYHKIRNNTEEQ